MPTYSGSFWALLNPLALLAGVVSSAMITLQGATLPWRTALRCKFSAARWSQA